MSWLYFLGGLIGAVLLAPLWANPVGAAISYLASYMSSSAPVLAYATVPVAAGAAVYYSAKRLTQKSG